MTIRWGFGGRALELFICLKYLLVCLLDYFFVCLFVFCLFVYFYNSNLLFPDVQLLLSLPTTPRPPSPLPISTTTSSSPSFSPCSTSPKDLDDNRWHKVMIQVNQKETFLAVDEFYIGAKVSNIDFQFGSLERNNFVFLGGMPATYRELLKKLALPSIMFDKR